MRVAIDQRVQDSGRRFRVIPVLLPGAKRAERSSLPTFLAATTWVEFHDSLDDAAAFHRLVCGIRGIEPGADLDQALYEGQCPYRGLRVFDVDDAPFFFGREALMQWLLNELRPATEDQPVNRFWPSSAHPAAGSHRWRGPAWSQPSSTMLSRAAIRECEDECDFRLQLWSFQVLAIPEVRELAVESAAQADFVILSLHGKAGLPVDIREWIETWSKLITGKGPALIALVDKSTTRDGTNASALAYLKRLAKRTEVDFFGHTFF
jgi:hypothetical protein